MSSETAKVVSRFEFDLVRILRFLLGHFPPEHSLTLILTKKPAPSCLSSDCVHLVRDTISKGIIQFLVRAGGWRNDRFLRENRASEGRAWERTPLAERALHFSRHTLSFLIWLTAEKPTEARERWDAPSSELTPADELFFCLAIEALSTEPTLFELLRSKAVFERNPFCWLVAPGDFAISEASTPPSFAPLFHGPRLCILECLQSWLTQRWLRNERSKGQISDWKRLRLQGTAEAAMFSAFLKEAEAAKRFDLARFLLQTLSRLFEGESREPGFWTGGLSRTAPLRLAERIATQRAALAVPQQAEVLARWDRTARSIGYFDEDYTTSQFWKEEFESADGPGLVEKSRRLREQIEPLQTQEPRQD